MPFPVPSIRVSVGGIRDYELLDSGNRRKLERFGPLLVERSETKAWWAPRLPAGAWAAASARYDEDDGWQVRKSAPRAFPLDADGLPLLARITAGSRHLGIFPEQSGHWKTIRAAAPRDGSGRLLNLFGYTGAATLAAAQAGWRCTHVDASKPALAWARENQARAGLENRPVRWILEDAAKYVAREIRRGSRYEAVLLDPPAFGRAPDGGVWKMETGLRGLLELVRGVLSERAKLVILTAYNISASALLLHTMVSDAFASLGGEVEIGELALPHAHDARLLPLSLYAKWSRA